MAWTQTDLDTIKGALASGELSVTFEDGRRVEYRSTADLLLVKRSIESELSASSATRLSPRHQQANFADG